MHALGLPIVPHRRVSKTATRVFALATQVAGQKRRLVTTLSSCSSPMASRPLQVSGSATAPKHRGNQIDLHVFGSEGVLVLDIERERLEVWRRDGRDRVVEMSKGAGAYACEKAVERPRRYLPWPPRSRDQSPGDCGQALAVEVLDALYRPCAFGAASKRCTRFVARQRFAMETDRKRPASRRSRSSSPIEEHLWHLGFQRFVDAELSLLSLPPFAMSGRSSDARMADQPVSGRAPVAAARQNRRQTT